MEPVTLEDASTGSSACIAPHLGFNCYEFRAYVDGRTVEVIDSEPGFLAGDKRPSWNGIPILFPFPNRIRVGRYRWAGRDFEIPSELAAYDRTGNAIHGFCLDRPWRVTDRGRQFVVGEFQLSVDAPDRLPLWPADFVLEVRYELRRTALRADIRIANPSDVPLPWGFGTHAYFRLPLAAESEPGRCLIQAPAAEEWDLIDCLPTGKRRPVSPHKDLREGTYYGQVALDDVQTGLQPSAHGQLEFWIIDERAGLQVAQRCPALFRELVVFTPGGRNAVCLEPYTCLTDAVNLQAQGIDAGLRVLEPGAELRTWITIEAGPVLV